MVKRFAVCVALACVLVMAQGALAEEGKPAEATAPVARLCTAAEQGQGDLLAGRGCCSHHQGQCGCQGGRVVCCDGSLSPSCSCEKDEGPVN